MAAPDPHVADGGLRFESAAGRWVLLTTVLGSGMAFLDGTVVTVALPRIGEDLGADFGGLSWISNGYLVTLSALILVGGSTGDRLGHRRTYLAGAVAFAVTSLLCALAPGVGALVGARLLQGVAAAFLVPGSLALIQASFHPDDRSRAIGAWSGLAGVTTAIGPFLGGWLVDAASWRWVFLLNLPLAAVVVAVGRRHLPADRPATPDGPPDVLGAVLVTAGLASSTYGLVEESIAVAGLGLVALVAFVVVEARSAHPMLPLSLFRVAAFSGANVTTFAVYGALGSALFLLSLVLQVALGYSPLEAGAATVPITLVMLVFSSRSGALAQRIGARLPMTLGPAIIAAGLLLMVRVEPGTSYGTTVLPALLVFSAGLTLTVAPLTATVLAAVEADHAGVASGVNNAVARAAGLVAVASLPLVAGLDATASLAGDALVDGFHRALVVAAVVAAAGGVVAWLTVPSAPPSEQEGVVEAQLVDESCFHCGVAGPPPPVGVGVDRA